MSIIDNAAHSVVTYDPKTSKAFTGQRLARFSWKTSTDKDSVYYGVKRESKCVSVPVVSEADIANNLVVLTPAIVQYLHSVQDKMIREQIESRNVSSVVGDSIGIAAICEWLEQNDDTGGRLTKESVGAWFDSSVSEMLAVALGEKLGVSEVPTDEESNKVMLAVAAFRGKVAALAGGKTSYEPKVCRSLISALELVDAGDALAGRFTARLKGMIAAAEEGAELIDLL